MVSTTAWLSGGTHMYDTCLLLFRCHLLHILPVAIQFLSLLASSALGTDSDLVLPRNPYEYVLCYYDEAIDFAIANLQSENPDARKLAEEMASRAVSLRLYGQVPERELKMLSLLQKVTNSAHMKFEGAKAQIELGSQEGLPVIAAEFRDKNALIRCTCSYAPYDHEARFEVV